jgi:two-component system chemotaxis response regulator CheY
LTVTKLSLLAVDPDLQSARALSEAFTRADFGFRAVPDLRRALRELRSTPVDVVLAVGNLDTPLVSQLLGTLAHDATLSRLPVVILGEQAPDASFVSQMRTGVVEVLLRPFQPFEHPDRVRQVVAELPERTGRAVGFQALRMVDHIQRTFRSGALKLNPGTPAESQALFTQGVLRGARHREAKGEVALAAMLALPRAPWAFVQLSGQEGEGTEVAIHLDKKPAVPPPSMEQSGYDILPEGGAEVLLAEGSGPIAIEADAEGEQLLVMESVTPTPAPPHVPILLVDDDEELCRMFGALFRRKGFDVTTAQDGLAGYEAAASGNFELLIADLNMPKMDGWGLLRLIRDDYRTRELPFAMLSCQDVYRESLKALDAGAQAYFPKTLRLEALVSQVQSLLQPRQQARVEIRGGTARSIPVGQVGVQWTLRELSAAGHTGTLRARDSWATYEVAFRDGRAIHASAQTGSHQAVGERALNAFVASRSTEASWNPAPPGPRQTLMLPIPELLVRASQLLNDNARRLRDGLMVNPLEIHVNPELYEVYVRNGPQQWLPAARLLCEQGLPPREVLARLDESPLELEEVLRDLIRRGVVSLSAPPS